MVVIITGYKGFIGKKLLEKLKELNYDVYSFEIDTDFMSKEFEVCVQNCDIIFHVGAISDTTLQDANKMLYYNYECSKVIFDLAEKYNKHVVYSSSAANYGLGNGIPTNIYGWSKKLAEDYGLKTCKKFIALRYFNVYGPGEEHKGAMASVAYQAWKAGKFKLFPGNIKRDFIYITDIIRANLHAITLEKGVFDVGTGKAETFQSLVEGIQIPYNYHSKDKIPNWYQHFTQADKSKFMPGWKPLWNIQKGTKEYKNYLND